MSKVLGIREKNVRVLDMANYYCIPKDELIPVISLAWLEEYVERNEYMEAPLAGEQEWVIKIKDLLTAARKEAKK